MKVISGKIKDVEHLIETKMDQFKNMDLKELIPLIKKIAEGRIEMDKLKTSITNIEHDAEMMKMSLGEMDVISKLESHSELALQHRD